MSNYYFEQVDNQLYERKQNDLLISSDKNKLNISMIHSNLSAFYWAQGISLDRLIKSIRHSICYGLYQNNEQIGFARVVTDFSLEALLCDVFIHPNYQQQGFGKFLVATVLASPITNECARWLLLTRDAHGLYKKFGFDNSEFAMFRLTEI